MHESWEHVFDKTAYLYKNRYLANIWDSLLGKTKRYGKENLKEEEAHLGNQQKTFLLSTLMAKMSFFLHFNAFQSYTIPIIFFSRDSLQSVEFETAQEDYILREITPVSLKNQGERLC